MLKIAATFSLTGPSAPVGVSVLDAACLAVEEANAAGSVPRLELVVVGPGTSIASLAAGPIYAEAGLAFIVPYAHGAGGPAHSTTFRPVFSTSDMGTALANYLHSDRGRTGPAEAA